jgi:hypothetical protein
MATVEATYKEGNGETEQVEATWLTIPELSKITGKKDTALRMWAKRRLRAGHREHIRKEHGKTGDKWLVHSSMVNVLRQHVEAQYVLPEQADQVLPDHVEATHSEDKLCLGNATEHVDLISFETYVEERREWQQERDNLLQGMMMYRYKFEEADRQLKMLPAPVEVVTRDLKEKEDKVQEIEKDREQKTAALTQAQKILQQAQEVKERYKTSIIELKGKLAEEERVREAYRIQWELAQAELKKPWWKKMLGMK